MGTAKCVAIACVVLALSAPVFADTIEWNIQLAPAGAWAFEDHWCSGCGPADDYWDAIGTGDIGFYNSWYGGGHDRVWGFMEFGLPVLDPGAAVVSASLNFFLLSGGGELGVTSYGNQQGGVGSITGGQSDYGASPSTPVAISIDVTTDIQSDYANGYSTGAWSFGDVYYNGGGYNIAGGYNQKEGGFIPYLSLELTDESAPEPSSALLALTGCALLSMKALRPNPR